MGDAPLQPILTPQLYQQTKRLGEILMPYAARQTRALFEKELGQTHARLIHYTNAESAMSIIRTKRFWMRNTNCMSDYREVQHGYDIVLKFFSDPAKRAAFIEALDKCAKGVAGDAIKMFDESWPHIRFSTYISSMSEHEEAEDLHGRLSMWRAFGGTPSRVGIVLNIPSVSRGAVALGLTFSPVAYLAETSAHRMLEEVIANINANVDYLQTVERHILVNTVFGMLLAGVVCLKHDGFREEREWRAIYAPKCLVPSALMESSVEIISGVPQVVHKIPLDAKVSDYLMDLDFSRIFDRLIVGPTPYPWPMYEAFIDALAKAGIQDADKRLFASGIPIRV